jgi:hypothetical protein
MSDAHQTTRSSSDTLAPRTLEVELQERSIAAVRAQRASERLVSESVLLSQHGLVAKGFPPLAERVRQHPN